MTWTGLPADIGEIDFSGLPESVARTVRPAIERQIEAVISARIGLQDLAAAGAPPDERAVRRYDEFQAEERARLAARNARVEVAA